MYNIYTDTSRMESKAKLRSQIMELRHRLQKKDQIIKVLKEKINSMTPTKLSITHPEVHDEDAIIITAQAIKSLLQKHNDPKCCRFCKQKPTSIKIERRTGRFKAHYMCKTCKRVVYTWTSDVNWNEGNGGVTRKFVQGITASGINYWQYKRLCQFTCVHYLRSKEWNVNNDALYPVVTDLCEEFMRVCQHIANRLSPQGCRGAFDTAWSHKLKASFGSGCVVDTLTRAILWRYHCCAKKNSADPTAPVYTDTSASMEAFCARKCFEKLMSCLVKLELMAFDGDASTPPHFYSHYSDSRTDSICFGILSHDIARASSVCTSTRRRLGGSLMMPLQWATTLLNPRESLNTRAKAASSGLGCSGAGSGVVSLSPGCGCLPSRIFLRNSISSSVGLNCVLPSEAVGGSVPVGGAPPAGGSGGLVAAFFAVDLDRVTAGDGFLPDICRMTDTHLIR